MLKEMSAWRPSPLRGECGLRRYVLSGILLDAVISSLATLGICQVLILYTILARISLGRWNPLKLSTPAHRAPPLVFLVSALLSP